MKISEVIKQRLEDLILDGEFKPGQKLPPERELARQFNVSRPSLREAIQQLEARGLVARRQGDGTFVTDFIDAGINDPYLKLLASKTEGHFDLLEFRHGVEGMAAYYATQRASDDELKAIEKAFEAIEIAQIENTGANANNGIEALAVFEFYLAICQASHNKVILQLMRIMKPLIVANIEHNLVTISQQPTIPIAVNGYRQKLLTAILAREPNRAWGASHKHLSFIEKVLQESGSEALRKNRNLNRLGQ